MSYDEDDSVVAPRIRRDWIMRPVSADAKRIAMLELGRADETALLHRQEHWRNIIVTDSRLSELWLARENDDLLGFAHMEVVELVAQRSRVGQRVAQIREMVVPWEHRNRGIERAFISKARPPLDRRPGTPSSRADALLTRGHSAQPPNNQAAPVPDSAAREKFARSASAA